MGLRKYILKRVAYTFVLLFIVVTLNYVIFMLMPGDPVAIMASEFMLRPEQAQRLHELYGFGESEWVRYTKYVQNMIFWEFGYSYRSMRPVATEIMERLPNTVLLMGTSLVFAMVIGVVTGIYAASKRGQKFDWGTMAVSLLVGNLPVFWTGLVFLYVFGLLLGWFPFGHTVSVPTPTDPLALTLDIMWHLFLPALVLFIFSYGGYALLMRSTMIEALTEDFITTARAKGVDERTVLFRHAFRNAMLPLITSMTLAFAGIISGAIATESVFSWNGIGQLTWRAIFFEDYPVLQALFYVFALATIIANFVADLTYGFIDPRIKYD